MYEQVEKPKGKSKEVANSVVQKKSNVKQGLGFVDNRPKSVQGLLSVRGSNFYSSGVNKCEPLQREINPDWNSMAIAAPTHAELRDFYYSNVIPEVNRVVKAGYNADVIMRDSLRVANNLLGLKINSVDVATVVSNLNALIVLVNIEANKIELKVISDHDNPFKLSGQAQGPEDALRKDRRIREDVLVPLGNQHVNLVRGFRSVLEGSNILNGLLVALTTAGVNDANVAARGSAIRGTDRTGTRAYRPGTKDPDMSNDASDVDFFIFSSIIESNLNSLVHSMGSFWKQGGNIHPDKLLEFLDTTTKDKALINFQQRLKVAGINVASLVTAIRRFPTSTKGVIGRKSDITLLQVNMLAKFDPKEYVLV